MVCKTYVLFMLTEDSWLCLVLRQLERGVLLGITDIFSPFILLASAVSLCTTHFHFSIFYLHSSKFLFKVFIFGLKYIKYLSFYSTFLICSNLELCGFTSFTIALLNLTSIFLCIITAHYRHHITPL